MRWHPTNSRWSSRLACIALAIASGVYALALLKTRDGLAWAVPADTPMRGMIDQLSIASLLVVAAVMLVLTVAWAVHRQCGRLEISLTQSEHRLDALNRAAYKDEPTGLPNEPGFRLALQDTLAECDQKDQKAWLMVIIARDLAIPQLHVPRPALLHLLACRLRSGLRERECAGYCGGGEFRVIVQDDRQLASLIERLSHPYVTEGREFILELQSGAAAFPADSRNSDGLIECATGDLLSRGRAGDINPLHSQLRSTKASNPSVLDPFGEDRRQKPRVLAPRIPQKQRDHATSR